MTSPSNIHALVLFSGGLDIQLAAAICARYSDAGPDTPVTFEITAGKEKRTIKMLPAEQGVIDSLRI